MRIVLFSLTQANFQAALDGRHPGFPDYPPDALRHAVEFFLAEVENEFGPTGQLLQLDFLKGGSVHVLAVS